MIVERKNDDFDVVDIVEKIIDKIEFAIKEEGSCCGLSLDGNNTLFLKGDGYENVLAFDKNDKGYVLSSRGEIFDFVVKQSIADVIYVTDVTISYRETKDYVK